MATSGNRKEANLPISCEVCAEDFSHEEGHVPKLISCGHSFCEGCLAKLQKTRHRITNQRPQNFSMDMVAVLQYEIICPLCNAKTVLDKPCTSLPKNYGYLNLISEVLEREITQLSRCKNHYDYIVDTFCHDEEETIFLYCATYGDHKNHNVCKLSEMVDQQKTEIANGMETLGSIVNDYKTIRKSLEQRERELTETVESTRKNIISKFESVQKEVRKILDAKLESVLEQLEDQITTQLSLFEDAKKALKIGEFKELQGRAKTFLSKADEYSNSSIAKKKVLLSEMQTRIKQARNDNKVCTQHVYEIQVDSAAHILKSVSDLVNAWVCCVKETKAPSCESISNVLKRNKQFKENPFERIDCKLWWHDVLVK